MGARRNNYGIWQSSQRNRFKVEVHGFSRAARRVKTEGFSPGRRG